MFPKTLVAALLLTFTPLLAQPVINEIHYNPVEKVDLATPLTAPSLELWEDVHEFIEIHNPTSSSIDLAGWTLSGGIFYTFPANSMIPAMGYLVVAKNPSRIESVYSLPANSVYGDEWGGADLDKNWKGKLSNSGETIILKDALSMRIETVSYSDSLPYPGAADSLGASDAWTQEDSSQYANYTGRSLERVSSSHSAEDPANWVASPKNGSPSPGAANSQTRSVPVPVVSFVNHSQSTGGGHHITPSQAATVVCSFTDDSLINPSTVTLRYFIDDIESTGETVQTVTMTRTLENGRPTYSATIPAQSTQTIVRYAIQATSTDSSTIQSPRTDSPFRWHGYFVSPVDSSSGDPLYYIKFSQSTLTTMNNNLSYNPTHASGGWGGGWGGGTPFDYGASRSSHWNGTAPAVFAHQGKLYDVQIRRQGSPYFRNNNGHHGGNHNFKIKFPSYARFKNDKSLTVTEKDWNTTQGHLLGRAVGLPTSKAFDVDLNINGQSHNNHIHMADLNGYALENFYKDRRARDSTLTSTEDVGHLVKSSGLFNDSGPWGNANATPLQDMPASNSPDNKAWARADRYDWTYRLKNNSWKGFNAFDSFLVAAQTSSNWSNSTWVDQNCDVDQLLNYLAFTNWMGFWDDVSHNYFLLQDRSGKWSLAPWDFDNTMGSEQISEAIRPQDVIVNQNPFNQGFGPNPVEIMFLTPQLHRNNYSDRVLELVHTVLHPTELQALGVNQSVINFATSRRNHIIQSSQLGTYTQPSRPSNSIPANGSTVLPNVTLTSSVFSQGSSTGSHASSIWEVRKENGSYLRPHYRIKSSTDLTSHTLPPKEFEHGKTYYWRVRHIDSNGHPSIISAESSFTVGHNTYTGNLVINEFMASNNQAHTNNGLYPDWVEIHNSGSSPVNLSGYHLSDNLGKPTKYSLPSVTLGAGEYLLVYCDKDTNVGGNRADFSLKKEGEELLLSNASGQIIDYIRYGFQITDLSVARVADGSAMWKLSLPSPGQSNPSANVVDLADPSNLKINEWMAHSTKGSDWLELYNPTRKPISLGGLRLRDQNTDNLQILPPLSFIAPSSHVRYWADGELEKGAHHLDFSLSSDEDSIVLSKADGTIIDQVHFWGQTAGTSEGVSTDGSSAYARFTGEGNPAEGNAPTTDTDGDGMTDAWERAHRLDPTVNDADQDKDGDGQSNLAEYHANTDPDDDQSQVQLQVQMLAGGEVKLTFKQGYGRQYVLQATNNLTSTAPGNWITVKDLGILPITRDGEQREIPAPTAHRFYRIKTSLP